jgi:hypothetical protein
MIHITDLDADPDKNPARIRIRHQTPRLMTRFVKPPALLGEQKNLHFSLFQGLFCFPGTESGSRQLNPNPAIRIQSESNQNRDQDPKYLNSNIYRVLLLKLGVSLYLLFKEEDNKKFNF